MQNEETSKDNQSLAELLFPNSQLTVSEIEKRYPPRNLPTGAQVTRVGPSPTGPMHIGGIFVALVSERLAHQSGGVFYLRLEDTDKKREVSGTDKLIVESLAYFGLSPDEGQQLNGQETGAYGPYRQSDRMPIYQAYAKKLVTEGKAYPCFCTAEELEDIAKIQSQKKLRPGYWGEYAKWCDASMDDIKQAQAQNQPFVIRFRSPGSLAKKIAYTDLVIGRREFPENDLDSVLIKSDGLPTYHFAHVIDDHLMGTTIVVRANEWVASVPLHLQLFEALNWPPPTFAHVFPIMKSENGAKRKLSKRKDPEATVEYYMQEGIPPDAVKEYLLNIANSAFENWRTQNPDEPYENYQFDQKLLGKSSGALFDMTKLNFVSRRIIAKMPPSEIFLAMADWANRYRPEVKQILVKNKDYVIRALGIERGTPNDRKDIARWSEAFNAINFFLDEIFTHQLQPKIDAIELSQGLDKTTMLSIVRAYTDTLNNWQDKEGWLNNLKQICTDLGFAESTKQFKDSPTSYKGHIGDVARVIRVLLCGQNKSPDLYEVSKVLGQERIIKRLKYLDNLSLSG